MAKMTYRTRLKCKLGKQYNFNVQIIFNDICYLEYIRLHNMKHTLEIIYVAIYN